MKQHLYILTFGLNWVLLRDSFHSERSNSDSCKSFIIDANSVQNARPMSLF